MGEPDFSKFKTVIHDLILEGEKKIQQPSKMTMEPLQWEFFYATRTEPTTSLD